MARKKRQVEVIEEVDKAVPVFSAETEPKKNQYFVSRGQHVNSSKGILPPGTEVFPDYFPGGMVSIEQHIAAGVLHAKGVKQ